MNIPRYFAAKRTIHQKFISTPHHHAWSTLLYLDITAIEHRQKHYRLPKTYTTTYSEYLDHLIETKQEEKLFLHNYYNGIRTLSGGDQWFSDGMKDVFGVDSEFGKSTLCAADHEYESFRTLFLGRVETWTPVQRMECLLEMAVAKELMHEFLREL